MGNRKSSLRCSNEDFIAHFKVNMWKNPTFQIKRIFSYAAYLTWFKVTNQLQHVDLLKNTIEQRFNLVDRENIMTLVRCSLSHTHFPQSEDEMNLLTAYDLHDFAQKYQCFDPEIYPFELIHPVHWIDTKDTMLGQFEEFIKQNTPSAVESFQTSPVVIYMEFMKRIYCGEYNSLKG